MAKINKITTSLSVAATVLLEACSSSGGDTASLPTPVANTIAPQLVATWETDCIMTQNAGSTVTGASGGGGGGSVAGGEAYRTQAVFNQDGRVAFTTEYYANALCNANTLAGLNQYNAVYFIGNGVDANDGSPVTEIDIADSGSTTYSIFQVAGSELYLGDATRSSPGMDGSSEVKRLDGLNSASTSMLKR